jgi:hypothetical protein
MKKTMILFSLLLVVLTLFISTNVSAAIGWNGGVYTNLYGCSPGPCGEFHTGNYCNPSTGSCSGGGWVVRYTCDGKTTQCTSNEESNVGSFGASCGKTQQIDVFNKKCRLDNGGWDTTCVLLDYMVWYSGDCVQPPQPHKSVCGESCTTNADCMDKTSSGVPVVCDTKRNICVNSLCPNGAVNWNKNENAGTICICPAIAQCGDPCGYGSSKGLCADGISSCTYVKTDCKSPVSGQVRTYCVPNDGRNDVERITCGPSTPDPKNRYLEVDGKTNWMLSNGQVDVQSIKALCTQTYCGDGIVQKPNAAGTGGPNNDGYEQCDGTAGVGPHQICDGVYGCTLKTLTYCGDGIKQSPNDDGQYEQCDGNSGVGPHEQCTSDCKIKKLTYCGDGIKQSPNGEGVYEQCDINDGVGPHQTCSSDCKLKNVPYCEMKLVKADDPDPVHSSEVLTYTLWLKNIGTGDCTGGGVLLKEYYDPRTKFIESNPSPTTGNNEWNFGTMHPGDMKEITIKMKVNANQGDVLENKACFWTKEYNTWVCTTETTYVLGPLTYCGDGVKQSPNSEGIYEACDSGSDNGKVCVPGYGKTCNYCDSECSLKTVKDGYCGDNIVQQGYEQCETDSQCNDYNVKTSDSCVSCQCTHNTLCTDECSLGDTKCSGNSLLKCGNFDSDACLEFGVDKDCYYKTDGDSYYQCESSDSVKYKGVKEGFCNDQPGNKDYCDSKSYSVKLSTTSCGQGSCKTEEFCKDDDVYKKTDCTQKSCNQETGHCVQDSSSSTEKVQDCGVDTDSGKSCSGNFIVSGSVDRGCKVENGKAQCFANTNSAVLENCGLDTCISHTNLDPFTKEYVTDDNSCKTDGSAYCAVDLGDLYDYCSDEGTVQQAACQGTDSTYKPYSCNQLDGCYDVQVTQCVKCDDGYGNCYTTNCQRTGKEYRDYSCGDGACSYTVNWQDADNDKIDDRCDSCVDSDRDGICDDKDNCPNTPNQNQIDRDHDGLGDACDVDRDQDGYPESIDCNDWNAKINPGMKEIPNNHIDDDCDPDTKDTVAQTSQEMLFVEIDTPDESQINAGEYMPVIVTVTNNGNKRLYNVQVSVTLPALGIRQNKIIRQLSVGKPDSESFRIFLPKNSEGLQYMRVTVSNDDYKRGIYREFIIS